MALCACICACNNVNEVLASERRPPAQPKEQMILTARQLSLFPEYSRMLERKSVQKLVYGIEMGGERGVRGLCS